MRKRENGKPLIIFSAICIKETEDGKRFLLAVEVGQYTNSLVLRRQISNRNPPAVLAPYIVMCVVAKTEAETTLKRQSERLGIPIWQPKKKKAA